MAEKTRKRNRVPISCIICRRRKVKCDKGKPKCQNCIKNGVEDKCHYIEPSWAKDPEEGELTSNKPLNRVDEALKKELANLKDKVKSLEAENSSLKRDALSTTNVTTLQQPVIQLSNNAKLNRSKNTADLMDCIFNSNILFTAKKGRSYNFTITYQISTLSWMFIVKNDIYLNDLWMKILKLRQHYEYYYSPKTLLSNSISNNYKHFKMNKIHGQEHLSITSTEKTTEHTSKLKNFLEGTLQLPGPHWNLHSPQYKSFPEVPLARQGFEKRLPPKSASSLFISNQQRSYSTPPSRFNTDGTKTCPVYHNSNSPRYTPRTDHAQSPPGSCPVTGNSYSQASTPHHTPKDSSNLVFTKCPVLHPNDSLLAYVEKDSKNLEIPIGSNGEAATPNPEVKQEFEESKVCPLMIGDAKAMFKEKLSKMNTSALRDTIRVPSSIRNSPMVHTPTTPLHDIKPEDTERMNKYVPIAMKPEARSDSLKRPLSSLGSSPFPSRKFKTISPSAVKNLNYNNTKQVISVIEQYLPNRKIVWLLVDRFFDKLYIQMPYIDEQSFRLRLASIINTSSLDSERINLSSIGTQYGEEFLNICLMVIIIRLSCLSLPTIVDDDITSTEILLMKPENFVTLVLVDMVKEIFSSAKLMNKPSLIIFQVALYLKIYNTLSPEDGFDLDDSYTNNNVNNNLNSNSTSNNQSHNRIPTTPTTPSNDLSGDLTNEPPNMNSFNFNAMLVQLAYNIGLNRDPLNFRIFYSTNNNNDDPITNARLFRKRHLWRKLWYGLICIMTEVNLSLGDYKKGILIEFDNDPNLGEENNKTWDCRLPGGVEQGVLERSYDSGKALQRELCVIQIMRESIGMYKWIYKGLKLLENVKSAPLTKDIEQVINKLNEFTMDKSKYGFTMDVILGENEISNPFLSKNSVWVKKYSSQIKIHRLKVHLIVKNMSFALNYLVFLNHEQKFNKLISDNQSSVDKIEVQRNYIETFFENTLLLALDNFKIFTNLNDGKIKFPNINYELLICPYLLILNHRSHEFLISLILRLQQQSPLIIEILNKNNIDPEELNRRLFKYLETFIIKLDSLTKKYYYAWGLKKLVKLFYKILTNSQKFFNINFKQMDNNGGEESEVEIEDHHEDVDLTSSGGSINVNANRHSPLNAFEIAFGTSKLPPVTDFTQFRAPKEIPISFDENGMNDMGGNVIYDEISPSRTIPDYQSGQSLSNIGDFNELFEDNFLNEVTGFNVDNYDDYFAGMKNTSNANHFQQFQQQQQPQQHQQQHQQQSQKPHQQQMMMLMDNNSITSKVEVQQQLKRNSIYNSLYEIDFTNVDLNNSNSNNNNNNSNSNNNGRLELDQVEDQTHPSLSQWGLFEP